jgi:hypothetical protein
MPQASILGNYKLDTKGNSSFRQLRKAYMLVIGAVIGGGLAPSGKASAE